MRFHSASVGHANAPMCHLVPPGKTHRKEEEEDDDCDIVEKCLTGNKRQRETEIINERKLRKAKTKKYDEALVAFSLA